MLDPLSKGQPAELRSPPEDWGARLTQAKRGNLSVKDFTKGVRNQLILPRVFTLFSQADDECK